MRIFRATRARGLAERRRATRHAQPACQAAADLRCGAALAQAKSRTKGGIRAMAKKTAKGGKKKGGKKR
jgi:hypothetical protein